MAQEELVQTVEQLAHENTELRSGAPLVMVEAVGVLVEENKELQTEMRSYRDVWQSSLQSCKFGHFEPCMTEIYLHVWQSSLQSCKFSRRAVNCG